MCKIQLICKCLKPYMKNAIIVEIFLLVLYVAAIIMNRNFRMTDTGCCKSQLYMTQHFVSTAAYVNPLSVR